MLRPTHSPLSKRVRIHSHVTKSKFLHVEDALNIVQGKTRIFARIYHRNQGMQTHCHLTRKAVQSVGTLVFAKKQTECNTYARYRQEKGAGHPSRRALLQFYQQQMTV